MIAGLQYIQLPDQTYGAMKIALAIPKAGDPWGVLRTLQNTIWGKYIPEITGEAMAHARHGFSAPLMKELGAIPLLRIRAMTWTESHCAQLDHCAGASKFCRPGIKLPDCYEAPLFSDEGERKLASALALAWRDGWYVVVVLGEEFILR